MVIKARSAGEAVRSDASVHPKVGTLIAGLFLFVATAVVVVWQNSRLAVLFDLAYVLENAYRMSLGQVPYRDFPFPHPPLTFLIQALVIKLTGRVYWHHIAYCALIGGSATVLTWRMLLNLLRPIPHADIVAFVLSLPLIALGIYCVFPHPFYDPDSTFAMLASLTLIQHFARPEASFLGRFLAGLAVAVPVLIKQNVGLVFFALTCSALLLLSVVHSVQNRPSGYGAILIGALMGLLIGALLIEATAGLENYLNWTMAYAASQRMPTITAMLEIYKVSSLPISLGCFVLGAFALWWGRTAVWAVVAAMILAAPFIWPSVYLLLEADPSESADRLLNVWPPLLIASLVVGVLSLRSRLHFSGLLPFILFGTVNAAFMSQQLWGSTYGIWPLFILLVAGSIISVPVLLKVPSSWFTLTFSLLFSISMLIAGASYVWSHERLNYAKLSNGRLAQAGMPEVKGLATRGRWIPDFEELTAYVERQIPREDAILMLPDEDLFYYATGREPRFRAQFDPTNAYSFEQALKLKGDPELRWLIVKREKQLDNDDINSALRRLAKQLEPEFTKVKRLRNYDVYRRPNG
jgi:4-amino-4-deoxy-L-arabinose transferase-like glycosyltransferase